MSEVYKLQVLFARLVPRLIDRAFYLGFDVTIGEVWRSPSEAARNAAAGTGIANSLHIDRLAIDLNLFRAGVYLDKGEDHILLGVYWKSLDPKCRWGGEFRKPDPGHYSIGFGGRA